MISASGGDHHAAQQPCVRADSLGERLQLIFILQSEANSCYGSLLNHPPAVDLPFETCSKSESFNRFTQYDVVNHKLRKRRLGITVFVRIVGFPCVHLGRSSHSIPALIIGKQCRAHSFQHVPCILRARDPEGWKSSIQPMHRHGPVDMHNQRYTTIGHEWHQDLRPAAQIRDRSTDSGCWAAYNMAKLRLLPSEAVSYL